MDKSGKAVIDSSVLSINSLSCDGERYNHSGEEIYTEYERIRGFDELPGGDYIIRATLMTPENWVWK